MKEISSLIDQVPVYTRAGRFVGHVRNAILDVEGRKIEAILVTSTNHEIVEGGLDVAVPYRWVADYADILVLRYFPDRVDQEASTPVQDDGEEFIEVPA